VSKLGDFLAKYPSAKTQQNYRNAVTAFLESVYTQQLGVSGVQFDGKGADTMSDQYVKDRRKADPLPDVDKFLGSMTGRAPKTIRMYLSAVHMFLDHCDFDIKDRDWKRITRRVKGSRARTMDEAPTRKQLFDIISQMNKQGEAFYKLCSSSGLREAEALNLMVGDVDFSTVPTRVNVRGELPGNKSGEPRYTFCSREATEALKGWLAKSGKTSGRIFDYKDTGSASKAFLNAVKKVPGLDRKGQSTHIHTYHGYVVRKYFLSTAKLVSYTYDLDGDGQPEKVDGESLVEAWAGHEGYLDAAYRRYNPTQMAEFYKQAEPALSLTGAPS
jgi:integrase